MEKILQSTIVKQGLIIAYYFSNRWYRKCLFSDSQIRDPKNSAPAQSPGEELDETEAKPDKKYTHKQTDQHVSDKRHQFDKKNTWDEDVKNPAITKKTD
ncbi:MAG: hypothetical protein LBF27_15560 [Sphingobacterium sp.]|jgi:hypothetical protein|nr:hypothetical protein [Sphingobacterium sp.]